MASVALAAALAPLPGGTFIGAAVGGIVDQTLLFPALFPSANTDITGPRIQDLRLQSAAFGSPLNFCLGPENRVAGVVIFMSDLKERKTRRSGGGKGGSGPSSTEYTYSVDLSVHVCDGPIQSIKRIWADGTLMYEDAENITVSGTDVYVERTVPTTWNMWPEPEGTVTELPALMRVRAPENGTALSSFKSGQDVIVSGFSNSANNGTFRCNAARVGPDGSEQVILANPNCVDEAAGNLVTLTQEIPPLDTSLVADVVVHLGTATQTPSALIESYKGAGEVPAFRGSAYVDIEDLQLRQFGNRLPSLTFEVVESSTRTTASCITQILKRAGWDDAEFDVVDVPSEYTVRGWAASGPSPVASQLQPIMLVDDLTSFERGGLVKFITRDGQDDVYVEAEELGARTENQRARDRIPVSDPTGLDLPRKIVVKFYNPALEYQQDTSEAQRIQRSTPAGAWTTGIESEAEVSVPMVLSAAKARSIANRVLWTAWRERRTAEVSLPPSFFHVEPGDVLLIEDNALRVQELARGALSHVHRMSTLLADTTDVEFPADEDGDEVDASTGAVYLPPDMTLLVLDLPALIPGHETSPGYYTASCASDRKASFVGASLFVSLDGITYAAESEVPAESIVFVADTELQDTTAIGFWDEESTLEITCLHGSIDAGTTPDLDVLNGANRAAIGGEIVAWSKATSLGSNRYRLERFLRGLRDTRRAVSQHAANEYGVVLNDAVQFVSRSSSDRGRSLWWKCVASGGTVADQTSVGPQTLSMATLRLFAPAHFEASRDPSTNDVTYSWLRVSRAVSRLFVPGTDVPMVDGTRAFEVDVYDSTDGSFTGDVVRTLSSLSNSVAYAAATQAADGLTPGTKYDVRVYQLNGSNGRGNPTEGTL